MMPSELFDAAHYTLSPYAIPTFVAATVVMVGGVAVLIRERWSRVSVAFFLITLSISTWLFAFSWMYSTTNESIALFWAKAAYLGVPFISTAIYTFTVEVLQMASQHRQVVRISWLLSGFFATAIIGTETLIGGLYHYWWGYYPRYGWLSAPYLTFFFGLMIASLRHYVVAYRKAPRGTAQCYRTRAFLVAFAIVYIGSFDYLAKYGVALYPFGYLPVLVFVVLAARAIARYRLVDITAAFAVEPILEGMVEPVLVLDLNGTIRLVNRAACELFGLPPQHLQDQPVGKIVDHPLFTGPSASPLDHVEQQNYYEVGYLRPPRDLRILSLAVSIMRDQAKQPTAIVCFLRDITTRKQAELTFDRISEVAKDWKRVPMMGQISVAPEDEPVDPALAETPPRLEVPWFFRSGWRLFAVLCVALVLPMGSLIWFESLQVHRSLEAQALQQNTVTTRLVAKAFQEHLDGLSRYMESFAGQSVLKRLLEAQDREAVRAQLKDLVTRNPQIDRAFIVDPAGTFFADYPLVSEVIGKNFAFRDWYRGVSTTRQTYISEVYQREVWPQPYLVAIATPMTNDQRQTIGYLIGQHTMESLTSWLAPLQSNAVGTVYLTDRHGTVASESMPHGAALRNIGQHPAIREALAGREGSMEIEDPVSGAPSLISYTSISSAGWVILVRRAHQSVFALVNPMRRTIIGLALLILVAMLVCGFVWLNALRLSHQVLLAYHRARERYVSDLQRVLHEREQTEEALRQLAFIVESTDEAILSKAVDGTILSWNRGAERLYGYRAEEVKGRSIELLAPPDRRHEIQENLARLARGESIEPVDTVRVRKSGERIDVAVTISPIKDAAGQLVAASVIARDITERKRMEERRRREAELRAANERLEELAALKDEFVANVGHELRTPLTAIKEGVSLLIDQAFGALTDEQRDFLRIIDESIDRLTKLISQMLDLSKIEAGRLRLFRRRVSPQQLIETTLATYKSIAGRRTIKTQYAATHDVFADPDRILQVLGNLFSNAVKFTKEEDTITLSIEAREGDVAVSVEDDGVGIAKEDIPKLFQKFSQVGTMERQPEGTGLGLALCKELIELHGGAISAMSQLEQGSVFSFTLPIYTPTVALEESFNELVDSAKRNNHTSVALIALESGPLLAQIPERQLGPRVGTLEQAEAFVRQHIHPDDVVIGLEPGWVVILAVADRRGVQAIINRLQGALDERQTALGATVFRLPATCGVALSPADGSDVKRLLGKATATLRQQRAANASINAHAPLWHLEGGRDHA